MDFNKLFEMVVELSGKKDLILGDLRKDGEKIYIELDLVAPVNEQLQDIIKEQ